MQATVNLRSTAGFVILAGSLVSNIPTSAITGDIGLSPAVRSFISGFGLTEVTVTIYAADDISPAAKGDLTTAYNAPRDAHQQIWCFLPEISAG